jgi:hypothetical protein
MMTRKDYVSTAEILNVFAKDRMTQADYEDLVLEFADMFSADNPRFSTVKFQEACYEILDEELN